METNLPITSLQSSGTHQEQRSVVTMKEEEFTISNDVQITNNQHVEDLHCEYKGIPCIEKSSDDKQVVIDETFGKTSLAHSNDQATHIEQKYNKNESNFPLDKRSIDSNSTHFTVQKTKKRTKISSQRNSSKRKKAKITINLSQSSVEKSKMLHRERQSSMITHRPLPKKAYETTEDGVNCNDFLCFYSDIHEDQDIETQNILKSLSEEKIKLEVKRVEEECKNSKQKLSMKLKKDWDDEFTAFLNQVKELNQQLVEKQKKQKTSLAERVAQSITSKESEAREAIKLLLAKKKMQMDSINIKFQHHPNAPQNEQKKAAYLNQIQSACLQHQDSIKQKLEEYKVSKKAEYDSNRELLEKHHHKRKMELTAAVNKNKKRLFDKQTLQRFCHEELEHEKRRVLTEKAIATTTNPKPKEDSAKRERKSSTVSAIHRYETRKHVLDQKHVPTSFVVEIHSEGLHTILVQSGIDEERNLVHDFLPWGHKASELMHCLLCGEFPFMQNVSMNQNGNINELQGGQVKCTITDMRCKIDGKESQTIYNESATSKSPKALRKIIAALKQNMDSHSSNVSKCENLMNKNQNEMRRSEQKLHSLQAQTKSMLKPDGPSKLTIGLKQKLDSAFAKFENEISMYRNKAKELQHNLAIAQKKKSLSTEKLKSALKDYQQAEKSQAKSCKNYEDDKVSKAIVSLKRGIYDRGTDSERRKNNNTTITLRPTKTSESNALREFIKRDHSDDMNFMIRAEELYLLAVHPSCEARLSLVPNERKVWAEPGYQLLHQTFLRKTNRDYVKDISSEFNSIKSRQLATLFRRSTIG